MILPVFKILFLRFSFLDTVALYENELRKLLFYSHEKGESLICLKDIFLKSMSQGSYLIKITPSENVKKIEFIIEYKNFSDLYRVDLNPYGRFDVNINLKEPPSKIKMRLFKKTFVKRLVIKKQKDIDMVNKYLKQNTYPLNNLSEQKQNEHYKELMEENQLLLEQLHQVQEELEKYYLKYQEILNELEMQKAEKESLLLEKEGKIRELEGEKQKLSENLAEMNAKVEQAQKDKEEIIKSFEVRLKQQEEVKGTLTQKIEQLEAELNGKRNLIKNLTADIEQMKNALTEAEKDKAEMSKKVNEAINSQNQIEKERAALEIKLFEKDQIILQLQTESSELKKRQELLDEELFRAEAQIDLIKELLLKK